METDRRERKAVLLQLEPQIKQRVQQDARRHRRSMNAHIEHLLDEHLPPLEDTQPTRAAG